MPKVREQQAVYNAKPRRAAKSYNPSVPPRKQVATVLAKMKDSATYKDILYRVYVLHCIDEGEKDIQQGRVYSDGQVTKMLAKWLK